MLMALGPFRFTIPTYSIEQLSRSVSARVSSQGVIGARPPTHLLGPGEETMSLKSTFFPYHLNGGGLQQLEGVRQACLSEIPMMMVAVSGLVYGRWVITEVSDDQTQFGPQGSPQCVTVDMSVVRYVPRGSGTFIGLF